MILSLTKISSVPSVLEITSATSPLAEGGDSPTKDCCSCLNPWSNSAPLRARCKTPQQPKRVSHMSKQPRMLSPGSRCLSLTPWWAAPLTTLHTLQIWIQLLSREPALCLAFQLSFLPHYCPRNPGVTFGNAPLFDPHIQQIAQPSRAFLQSPSVTSLSFIPSFLLALLVAWFGFHYMLPGLWQEPLPA